jgi:hypothetical protein
VILGTRYTNTRQIGTARPWLIDVIGGTSSMPTTLIPWQAFFKAIQKQNSRTDQTWLVRWVFPDGRAALVQGGEKHKATPLSLEEKQPPAALFFVEKEK